MGGQNAKPPAPASPRTRDAQKNLAVEGASGTSGSRRRLDSRSKEPRIVLGKYRMGEGREDIMGKGTSSICYKGYEIETKRQVAIKLYREQRSGTGKIKDTTMQKFRRQIRVLNELMAPFEAPEDKTLWTDILNNIQPRNVFMELIDYSKDENGEPGPDPTDGTLYVVTELAQYSLKDLLADRRHRREPFSREATRDLVKRMLLAMAGLHAKGFVHIDMKPENVMVFDGRLKVIDVDGCVRAGTRVSINDGSISFSPCYCSPEWARFMIKETEQVITATPGLDVWSVGMTFCEFVTLDAIWKPQYANFMRNASSHREAGFLFLEWLGVMKRPPLPRSIESYDTDFHELLTKWLLVADPRARKTCAQTLENPYLAEGGWARYGEQQQEPSTPAEEGTPEVVPRIRVQDDSTGMPVHKGTVWKLNTGGDPKEPRHWINRDMWLAQNRSLCYYSVKENKRLVLIDGEKLRDASIEIKEGMAKEHAVEIKVAAEEKMPPIVLGFDSKEDLDEWMEKTARVGQLDAMMTFFLGAKMAEDVQAFRLAVTNRRLKVEQGKDGFEATFKAKLWKLKAQGDKSNMEDWFLRDMWTTTNGSLVYYSPKEERDLVYYTAADLAHAIVEPVEDGGSACRPHGFTITLSTAEGGVAFDPGEFAAETAEAQQAWIKNLCLGTAARTSEEAVPAQAEQAAVPESQPES